MPTITALTMQKRNQERVNVFLDGAFAFGLPLDAALSLKVGDVVSAEKIAELRALDEYDKARTSALNYLSYRPRSSAEVRDNLRRIGFDDLLADKVVERLTALQLLDDAAFARFWVEQRDTFKPRSHLVLRQELRRKGIAPDIIDRALADVDQGASARLAADQRAPRLAHLDYETFRNKLGSYLQRRGFGYELVRTVVDEAWEATRDPEHDG